MNIIVLAFLLLLLIGNKFSPIKAQFDDYLDIKSTQGTRGVLAILILLHHLSLKATDSISLLTPFNYVGYLTVGVFLFYSGYGLFLQYQNRGKTYLKSFWKTRVLSLFSVYIVYIIIYGILNFIRDDSFSIIAYLKTFVIGGLPGATSSWYIIEQLLLYIAFWIAFSIKLKDIRINIALVSILTILILVIFKLLDYPGWWFSSIFAFVIGLIFANYKEKINKLLSSKYLLCFLSAIIIFGIGFVGPKLLEHFGIVNEIISIAMNNIAAIMFAIIIITANRIIKFSSKVWMFLGSISLEIYLIQGAIITTLTNYIANKIIFMLVSIALTIIVAYPLSKIDKLIMKSLKK